MNYKYKVSRLDWWMLWKARNRLWHDELRLGVCPAPRKCFMDLRRALLLIRQEKVE